MPEDTSAPKNRNKRKRPFLRFLRNALLTLVALVALLAIAGFVFRDKIGAELKKRLDEQLITRGIFVDYTASDFAPLSGLTLSDVKVFRDSSETATAITLSEARLRFDPIGILRGKSPASIHLTTDGAGIVISDESGDYAIEDLDADLSVDRNGTDINQLEGRFRDLVFDVDAQLGWASDGSSETVASTPETPETDPADRVIDLSAITRYLDLIPDTSDGEATLRLTMDRETAHSPLALSGKLQGETVNWKALKAENVLLDFELAPNEQGALQLAIPQARLTLDDRPFETAGTVDFAAKTMTLEKLTTGVDPASLLPVFPEDKRPSLPAIPPYSLKARGTLDLADVLSSELSGELAIEGPAAIPLGDREPLTVSSLASPFTWKDRSLLLEGLSARLGENRQLGLETTATVRFPASSGEQGEPEAKSGTAIEFTPLVLQREQGSLKTSGKVDLGARLLTLDSLDSDVDIGGLLTDLGFPDPLSEKVRFPAAPTITASGTLPLDSPVTGADLSGDFSASSVEVPAGENRTAKLSELTTRYTLQGGKLGLGDFQTGVFGGRFSMPNQSLAITAQPITFDGRLQFDTLSLEEITAFANAEKRRTGQLTGFFEGNGALDLATLTGNGEIEITGAEFGTVPIFRALRPLLSAITLTNWKGETEGADMSSTFTFQDGVMTSDDIAVKGDFYEVHADTTVNFAERTLEAEGAVSTSGATKVLTQVVGKALEVEASGTFDDFSWSLKNAPGLGTVSDLAGMSKDLLGNTLSAAAGNEITGALLNGVKDTLTSGEPVKGAANMAEDTLKGVTGVGKKLLGFGRKKGDEDEQTDTSEEKSGEPQPDEPKPEEGN